MWDNKEGYSFLTPPPPIQDSDITETLSYDIVILGSGLAGLCAALRASELGARVAVLEKTASFNVRGGHIGVANSKVWRAIGYENNPEELAREWIAACGNRAREDQVWLFINRSEEAMDWLIDKTAKHGMEPVLVGARYTGSSYTERYGSHLMLGPKHKGLPELAENLIEDARANGADFYFNTPGVRLEQSEDSYSGSIGSRDNSGGGSAGSSRSNSGGSRIISAIGGTPGNYKRFLAAKAVLLATGDIHGDREMLEAYCPMFLKIKNSQYNSPGANTGDGHKMGLWAGGAMEDSPLPTVMHPQGYTRMQQFFLYVNTRGERFMNEDTWCQAKSLNVLKQPGAVDFAFSIFDADYVEQLIKGMPYSGGLFNDNSGSIYGKPFTGEREMAFVESGLANGLIKQADDLAELARLIDVPEDIFVSTVSRYNEHAVQGRDADYGKRRELLFPIKNPPFYAAKFGPAMLVVTGGLFVDTKLRVVNKEFSPIPGLYAIGNVAGGLYGVDYPTIIPGNSHGRAVTWGYIAAENAIDD